LVAGRHAGRVRSVYDFDAQRYSAEQSREIAALKEALADARESLAKAKGR